LPRGEDGIWNLPLSKDEERERGKEETRCEKRRERKKKRDEKNR
jgi:hypothetical protein